MFGNALLVSGRDGSGLAIEGVRSEVGVAGIAGVEAPGSLLLELLLTWASDIVLRLSVVRRRLGLSQDMSSGKERTRYIKAC